MSLPANTYLYRVYCSDLDEYATQISTSAPVVCPIDGSAIDPNATVILRSETQNLDLSGYVNIQSSLANSNAVTINASDTNGGINITCGNGGITASSTSAISLNAAATSNFTITTGDLDLQATVGSLNADGATALNIGNASSSTQVNIGTSAIARTITIGNTTGATQVIIRVGTGGLILPQSPEISMSDSDTTLSSSQILNSILTISPTTTRNWTLPDAADLVASITNVAINDSIDFVIIVTNDLGSVNLITGSGGTAIGQLTVTLSGNFRLRFTDVTLGSEAYTLYRLS